MIVISFIIYLLSFFSYLSIDSKFIFPFRRDHIREEQSLRICQGHPNIVRLQEVFQDDVSVQICWNFLALNLVKKFQIEQNEFSGYCTIQMKVVSILLLVLTLNEIGTNILDIHDMQKQ